MALFKPEDAYDDILQDLKEEIVELYEASEQTLIELEIKPSDNELQRSLFRNVHTIKGDLGLVSFVPMILVLQSLEDILDMLRKGELPYSSLMSDLVLLLLDKVSVFVDTCIKDGQVEYDDVAIENTIVVIKQLTPHNVEEHDGLFQDAISALSGAEPQARVNSSTKVGLGKTGIPKNIPENQQTDLLFFRDLMRPIEKRAGYNEGRGDKIAALALYINSLHENPIDESQLAVACYVHDFGMAFMPDELVNKSEALSSIEQNLIRSHVYKSTRLIEHLTVWDDARKIIMQHHENMDGSGYPLGIKGPEICEGAKLLSILDRYLDLISSASDSSEPLSDVEAVIAINKNYKGQLSGPWLRLFNQGVTEFLNA